MPLLDHFHLPLNRLNSWRTFHGTWAVAIARLLNAGVLPEGYYAVPFLDRDGPIEIDVAALHAPEPANGSGANGTQPWIPGNRRCRWPSRGRQPTKRVSKS